jgi:general secretion pathway protein B
MSLILDALKKAEAERNGDTARSVQMPPVFHSSQRRPSVWRKPWSWSVLAVSAVAIGTAAWIYTAPGTAPVVTQQVASAQVESKMPTATQPPAQTATPKEAPPVAELPPAKPKEKSARKPVEKKRSPAARESTVAAASAPAEPPVPTLRELPEHIQREIPALTIGGYIYSGNKADRSVLINKRLLREGDEVAPGLTLEKMMPNGMVMNYKGYRYRAGY